MLLRKKADRTRTKVGGRRRTQRGCAALEMALISPWIMALFIGVLDFGFYGYAVINTQNAARVAALRTSAASSSAADTALACTYALAEMGSLPNLSGVSSCSALPLTVTATSLTGTDSA